ncbi:MAG TPA: IPT/TIG domain-containing protein [Kofleriaceae bacterium]|nr:IPT/TIG domain-containing protein [Kofleriaceae bacterium]
MRSALLVALLVACSSSEMRLDRATPDYGPLAGGTRITLEGEHFPVDARVFVGDREAPLAAVSRDGTKLDVVIPPGDRVGPASITVIAGSSAASSNGFRYSTPPTITRVSPERVVPDTILSTLTITGTGFADEGAGDVTVLVAGVAALTVTVVDDTTLTADVALPGPVLATPSVSVIDTRGTATLDRAFRYVPSMNPGLLLFPNYFNVNASFYDFSDGSVTSLGLTLQSYRFTSVFSDERGDFWAIDRGARYGLVDGAVGQIADPIALGSVITAMTPYEGRILAIQRFPIALVSLNPAAGDITPYASTLSCCGSFGIAADGATVYVASRSAGVPVLQTFDPETDTLGAAVTLKGAASFSVEELRVVDHVLYATSRDGTLCTIDPTTGVVTVLAPIPRTNAFDVLR